MIDSHEGGCLCGQIRFSVTEKPRNVTLCACRFYQKATGSDHMVEPIFGVDDFTITKGQAKRYTHISGGSGKEVYLHFCANCGSNLYLSFERWDDILGVYSGAFDDPGWFDITRENAKYIFLDEAPPRTLIPAGIETFRKHRTDNEGRPQPSTVYDWPHLMGVD